MFSLLLNCSISANSIVDRIAPSNSISGFSLGQISFGQFFGSNSRSNPGQNLRKWIVIKFQLKVQGKKGNGSEVRKNMSHVTKHEIPF